ncbi:MAG: hypothetical protein DME99_12560 [Verrucomicrobia bacterium]|nr:MAG: hypothetical protein DME99_12560 [Verrucomicrobiota bacterium]
MAQDAKLTSKNSPVTIAISGNAGRKQANAILEHFGFCQPRYLGNTQTGSTRSKARPIELNEDKTRLKIF